MDPEYLPSYPVIDTLDAARQNARSVLNTLSDSPDLMAEVLMLLSGTREGYSPRQCFARYLMMVAYRELLAETPETKPRCSHMHIVGTDIGWACLGEGCGALFATSLDWGRAYTEALSS